MKSKVITLLSGNKAFPFAMVVFLAVLLVISLMGLTGTSQVYAYPSRDLGAAVEARCSDNVETGLEGRERASVLAVTREADLAVEHYVMPVGLDCTFLKAAFDAN